jgi:hypothetical protein
MRTAWVAWKGPIMTLVGIAAFLLALFAAKTFLSDGTQQVVPAAPEPAPAQHVNTRTWQMIARDPAGHIGERVVLWGQVTGLDPVGGAASFRANVDAARHAPENGSVNYPTNVIMHGDPDILRKVADGYIFTAEATVDGAGTPGARSDDATTVPALTVTKLTITDKTVG